MLQLDWRGAMIILNWTFVVTMFLSLIICTSAKKAMKSHPVGRHYCYGHGDSCDENRKCCHPLVCRYRSRKCDVYGYGPPCK
ncbi:hypothetical protein V5799_003402 [Amblyomma americanum]|uniref:Uncharacterized protein n=1 Tax=Amblyomma americanum TaxID=6943 RepID=A0AAQ4D928_AMBAM